VFTYTGKIIEQMGNKKKPDTQSAPCADIDEIFSSIWNAWFSFSVEIGQSQLLIQP